MNSIQVAATVILYNPEDDVYENINSYGKDVATLIVVDNSTARNTKLIEKMHNSFENLVYINNNANLGIATALNLGCEKAMELGFEWILTMDQDSSFFDINGFLQCALPIMNNEIAILTPNHSHIQKTNSTNCFYEEKEIVITSGNLVNLSIYSIVNGYADDFFIDMVDYDYCLKVKRLKYKILLFPNQYILHSLGTIYKRKNLLTQKLKEKIEHPPLRVYYKTRNTLYLAKHYNKISLLKTLNILFIHEVIKILLYENRKIKKLYAKSLALKDFFFNKKGARNDI